MTDQTTWLPHINHDHCNSCGDCITQCPAGVLGQHEDKAMLLFPELCVYCATCEDICPVNAIELPFLIVYSTRRGD